ncbi:MAG: UDP-N-acetylmuramoyl-tripeptide--D-alanyl-D-alanine ligase [Oscillospiraceae bacterium]|nr:UDP-N-acetylmuramoyl-tripeptide--D-alanyl-D-alanine ligase [Oscillospiraceae bacterium]
MFIVHEIAMATGGKLFGNGNAVVTGVSTDTRTIQNGDAYVAIKGERFDGNDFIAKAVENGAVAVITDRADGADSYGVPTVLVQESRAAQLALARYHRCRFPLKLCGVTGSVGKTSTKDMIYAVLSAGYNTLRTEGNFNNDIGLPKTLFRLRPENGAAVIEMGMSDLGEISVLSKAACPDCAVITNIGYCHIENLKTRDNILRAKLEILDGAKPTAPLIVCGDDEYLRKTEVHGRKLIRYGLGADCDVRAEDIEHLDNGERFVLIDGDDRYEAAVPVSGEHHVLNALAAYCVGREFGMGAGDIIPAFMNYEGSGMRQKTIQQDGVTYILDCYNASPTSMKSSLSVLGGVKAEGRKIAVLGDMLELGDMSAELHASVAEYVTANAQVAFLYGAEMGECAKALRAKSFEVYHSTDKSVLSDELKKYISEGDVLLFKGSRGMRLEEIYDNIK